MKNKGQVKVGRRDFLQKIGVGTVGAGVKTYSSTGLLAAKKYYYRVRAYSVSGNSAYSGTASATTKK